MSMISSSSLRPLADVVIVGAGIIGVTCAYTLARAGLRVVLVDRQAPGLGASFGNAGHLATEQVFPIANLSLLKNLPGMLWDPLSPLRLDWRYLPNCMPWLVRLLMNLQPAPLQRTVAGLRALNERSLEAWLRLLAQIGRTDLLRQGGSLLVYERSESMVETAALMARMRHQGVPVTSLQGWEVREMAPQLSGRVLGGLFFPRTGHFIDPFGVLHELLAASVTFGATVIELPVLGGELQEGGVSLHTTQGVIRARKVLIACGAHSKRLTTLLTGRKVPLETERGYHLMLPFERGRLPISVTSLERKFIMTPMAQGLRLAGTVEFAGLERPAMMARAWQLQQLSLGLFRTPLDTANATPWMGLRPSLPDSLPVIDQLCDGRVLLAFGHHHLGMTQAAVTAEIVAQLAGVAVGASEGANLSLDVYRIDRFG